MMPQIRVHPTEGFIAIRDRPDSPRPWAKVVPGIALTDDDVADWQTLISAAEIERLHSWAGLMELLDEHWPADNFPGGEDADPGPRIVGLLREVDRLRDELTRQVAGREIEQQALRNAITQIAAVSDQ